MTDAEMDKRFTYHPPKENQAKRYETVRMFAKTYAMFLDKTCPDSRELSLALTKIEESVFWANAAIARNE